MSSYRWIVGWLAHKRLVAAVWRRFGSRLDRSLYRMTRGRLGLMGSNVLLLTTTGRRSGQSRTTPVIYVSDGENLIVSSEDYGMKRPAAWPLNLDANARATVQIGAKSIACRARRLGEREADLYWQRLVEVLPAHSTYRERSGKRHTFILHPLDRSAARVVLRASAREPPQGASGLL